MSRKNYSPSGGKFLLPDGSVLDLSDSIKRSLVENKENGRLSFGVETQLIESNFSEEYTTEQTDNDIIAPGSGNKLIITDLAIQTKATSGVIELDFLDSGKKITRLYSSVNNRFAPQVKSGAGAINETLTLNTTTGTSEVFITLNYIEVEG